jgi:cytosine/uracil/thiamine/allantoin permease
MKQPDTIIAKYYFLALVGFLIFFIFSIMMWILNLGGQCSSSTPKEEKKKKKSNTIIYLMIFVLVCSMAAQAVNQSYTRIIPKAAINAAIKTLNKS